MFVPPSWQLRPIRIEDNAELAGVLRTVLIEMEVPKTGTAFADPELDAMYQSYDKKGANYWVIESDGLLYGGAGINNLQKGPATVCELQKMYFLPEARGLGLGAAMMQKCLETALSYGYKQCYIETMPNMKAAQHCYKKFGFMYIDTPLGNTGHHACPVWMLKNL